MSGDRSQHYGLNRRAAMGAIAGMGAVGSVGRAAAQSGRIIRIGWLKGTNSVALLKVHGPALTGLRQKGIELVWAGPFPASAPAVEAMNAGAIDITVGSSTSAVVALAAGAPLRLFTYQPMGPQAEAIIVAKTSDIADLKGLKGRKVAVNRGGTGEYLLRRAMRLQGLPEGSVTPVYLGPADAGNAFVQGAVDGWAIWDPWLSIALDAYDARILADRRQIGSDNALVTLVSEAFAARDPEGLQQLFDALQQEAAWAVDNPEAAGRLWAGAMDLPAHLASRLGQSNAVPERGLTAADLSPLERIASWYQEGGQGGERAVDLSAAILTLQRSPNWAPSPE